MWIVKSKRIPKTGFGYKIFRVYDNRLFGLLLDDEYEVSEDGWIRYLKCGGSRFRSKRKGFGFCLDRNEAERIMSIWRTNTFAIESKQKHIIKKIEYKKGVKEIVDRHLIRDSDAKYSFCGQFKMKGE